jgi:hypothetical protein
MINRREKFCIICSFNHRKDRSFYISSQKKLWKLFKASKKKVATAETKKIATGGESDKGEGEKKTTHNTRRHDSR